ncbi:MAG: type II toxin-antitoxin system VapC family toxin [Anaerolineae bacterium]
MRYYDASALVKFYVVETGSGDVRQLLRSDTLSVTSAVAGSEVPAAIARARRMGRITLPGAEAAMAMFRQEWLAKYMTLPLDDELALEAGELAWRHGLRGFDAAHLASAIALGRLYGERITVVTYDRHLWRAAKAEGMDAFPAELGDATPGCGG